MIDELSYGGNLVAQGLYCKEITLRQNCQNLRMATHAEEFCTAHAYETLPKGAPVFKLTFAEIP